MCPLPMQVHSLPHFRCLHQTECATVHEPLGTRRLRPEPTVYSRVTVGVIHCIDLDQYIITCIPSESSIHRRLTPLKTRNRPTCSSLSPRLTVGNDRSFYRLHSLAQWRRS